MSRVVGTKYTFRTALRHAWTRGTTANHTALQQELERRYGGTATLYHKGRTALAEAVRIASGGTGTVAISGLTCYSVVQAVEAAGCTPVFVDIREDDLNFGADELAAACAKHEDIAAVIVQNTLGIPANIAAIQQVAHDAGAVVIEDLAHSAGALYADGSEVGTVGDITMLSFGSDKAIDVVNGGAVIVRNTTITENPTPPSRQPRWRDQFRDRIFPLIAWTRALFPPHIGPYVMSAAIKLKLVVRSADDDVDTTQHLPYWQAKLALSQVKNLAAIATQRRHAARTYQEHLTPHIPQGVTQAGSAPIRMPLLVTNRPRIIAHLRAHGVQSNETWYDVPVSPRRLYSKAHYDETACPVAVRVAAHIINLPTHERVTEANIVKITTLVNEVAEQ